MTKIFLTMCAYPDGHEMLKIYHEKVRPRFVKFSEMHGFEFVEFTEDVSGRNWSWARLFWCKRRMETLVDGDIITMMDADCCIVDGRYPPEWPGDFSVARESTGVLCAGLFSIRVSEWSRKFIDTICSEELHYKNRDLQSWSVWHENDAIYHMLGLNWGEQMDQIGTRDTTPFTKQELLERVHIIPVEWNVTVDPDDYIPAMDKTDEVLRDCYRPDLHKSIDETLVRHFAGGRIYKPLINRYFERDMLI